MNERAYRAIGKTSKEHLCPATWHVGQSIAPVRHLVMGTTLAGYRMPVVVSPSGNAGGGQGEATAPYRSTGSATSFARFDLDRLDIDVLDGDDVVAPHPGMRLSASDEATSTKEPRRPLALPGRAMQRPKATPIV